MAKKIEVNEDDLKKVILIMKFSKPYLQLPPQDLFLSNLWRVAPKLADKLMKKANLTLVQNKSRATLKPIEETKSVEEDSETTEEVKAETLEEVTDTEKPHRCRKRKIKA